ncbi:MAG: 30S ribosome-binding factor RbfA [Pyrinomonadaceae bacterium]
MLRRSEKVAELVRDEILQIVGFELEDPKVASVTVTEVRMSENLREARVFVTVMGTNREGKQAIEALRKAAPFVRRQLGARLNMRRSPEVYFVRDTVEEKALRVEQLLTELGSSTEHDLPDTTAQETPEKRGEA